MENNFANKNNHNHDMIEFWNQARKRDDGLSQMYSEIYRVNKEISK